MDKNKIEWQRKPDYKVVGDNDINKIVEKVQEYILEGYEPRGGLTTGNFNIYYQIIFRPGLRKLVKEP